MHADEHDSVTDWLHRLTGEDESAAQQKLWNRYFSQLSRIARARLRGIPGQVADEEDVALSVMNSFFRGAREGRFPDLQDRSELWPLLMVITARKSINQIKHRQAKKRSKAAEEHVPDLATLMSDAPTPEFALEMAEQVERLLDQLQEDQLKTIAVMKLEGHTNEAIAAHFNIAPRSIARKLARIRVEWQEHTDSPR